jgi:SAM-dependent methyltransferase
VESRVDTTVVAGTEGRVLDLGCGTCKEPDAVGVDNVGLPGVDLVHDLLDFPYPFADGSAREVYLKHVVEHFPLPDIQRILGEVYRVLEPGGLVHVRVPHVFSVAAWEDPTHRMGFTFRSAIFFTTHADKAYYKETENRWELAETSARVTWFNWKRYSMRRLDGLVSKALAGILNWLLRRPTLPGSADLLVKALPIFFVEVRWTLRKPAGT